MRERQGCRSASIEGDTVMWVIDVSLGCALGAWTVLSAPSLMTAGDCLLTGRLGVPSLPVLAFR
jgi:hypothetical protein